MNQTLNLYTVRLMRSDRVTVASYDFAALDDSLTDSGLRLWLAQFQPGAWPFFSVLENGVETGLEPKF